LCLSEPSFLELPTTPRVHLSTKQVRVRVSVDPREQFFVQLHAQVHVCQVVSLEALPRMRVTLQHLQPQRKSLVNDLLTDTETLSNVIKLIAEELELFLSCPHKVNLLRRTRRGQPAKNELSVRVLSVETCTVPRQ